MCPPPSPSEWLWKHRWDINSLSSQWFYQYRPAEDDSESPELLLAVTRTSFDYLVNDFLTADLVSLVKSYVPFIDCVTSIQSHRYQLTVSPKTVPVDTNVLASCEVTIWDPVPFMTRSGDYVDNDKKTAELMHLPIEDDDEITKCYFLHDLGFDPRRLIRITYDMNRLGDETAKTLLC